MTPQTLKITFGLSLWTSKCCKRKGSSPLLSLSSSPMWTLPTLIRALRIHQFTLKERTTCRHRNLKASIMMVLNRNRVNKINIY